MKKTNLVLIALLSLLCLGNAFALVKPKNLQVINLTDSSCTITWEIPDSVASEVTNHTIFIKVNNDDATQIVRYVDKDTRSIDLIGTLSDGNGGDDPKEITFTSATTYNVGIFVEPVDWNNSGDCSAWINANTLADGEIAEPGAPDNLQVSNITATSFTLTWENASNSTQTNIGISDTDASGNQLWVANVAAGINTYTYTGKLKNWDGLDSLTISANTNYSIQIQSQPDLDYNAYSATVAVHTAVATSLNDNTVATRLSPNPTSGMFKVDNTEAAFVEVYTMTGKAVYQRALTQGSTINISKLQGGTYIVRTLSANKAVLSIDKLIKL